MNNLEVVNVFESGDYGIAFFRYSIGADIFREAYWTGKVNGRWYWIPYLSEYSDNKPKDEEWLKKMTKKKEIWEEASAKPRFE